MRPTFSCPLRPSSVPAALLACLLAGCGSSSAPASDADSAVGDVDAPVVEADAARDGSRPADGIDPGAVVINEVSPRGSPDWFELYNRSASPVRLDRYSFSDKVTRQPFASFPPGTVIEPDGYVVIELTDDYPGFKLSSDETLLLATAGGEILDQVDLEPFAKVTAANNSVGRLPNGTGDFQLLHWPTPGGPNTGGTGDVIPAGFCPQGAWQCPDGSGCVQGRCGPCQAHEHCSAEDRCLPDGTCGPCGETLGCGATETCRHGFCLPKELPHWSLTIDPWAWQEMLNDPWSQWLSSACSLGVGTTAYADSCRMRIHGGSSRDFPKKSLRIMFDEDRPHPGFSRKIILRAEYNDASFLRNVLGYALFRRFSSLPAPWTRFVKLDINGTHYGLFVEVMRIGPKFLRLTGRDDQAPTYEADLEVALGLEGGASFVPLPDASTYAAMYPSKTGDENDFAPLIDLIENQVWQDYLDVSQKKLPISRIPQVLHYEGFLDYLAIMGVIQNHDHVRKNYAFSLQPASDGTPRWEFYPWDLDLTFGCLWNNSTDNSICDQLKTQEGYAEGIIPSGVTPQYPSLGFYNVLLHLALTDPTSAAAFEQRICDILNSTFWQQRLHDYIDGLRETISKAVQDDPNDRNADLASFDAAVDELHTFVDQREAFLRSELSCSPP